MKYLSVSIVKVGSRVKFKSTVLLNQLYILISTHTVCHVCRAIVYKVYAVPSSIQDFYF